MREISTLEATSVGGGVLPAVVAGAVLAWVWSNRGALQDIAKAASEEASRLDEEDRKQ